MSQYLPVDVCGGPEVFKDSFGQQVPDLRPHPARLVDGVRQEFFCLIIRLQLDELLLQLFIHSTFIDAVPL